MGNLIRYVDQAGNSTELDIGPFRQVVGRVDPDGSRHRFDYDTELQLRAVLNPRGQSWDYRYDELGNLVGESDFNGRSLSYEYDAAGRLMRRTAANGDVVEYERDLMGRSVVQRVSDGQVITTQYDSCGRRARIGDGVSEIVYHRDALGRVVSESTNGRTVNFLRDAAGRRVSLTTPSGRTTNWSHDAAGRSLSLQTGSENFFFSYDAAGRESHVQLSPKAALTNEWDSTGRLARRRVLQVEAPASSGRAALEQAWSYRPDGNAPWSAGTFGLDLFDDKVPVPVQPPGLPRLPRPRPTGADRLISGCTAVRRDADGRRVGPAAHRRRPGAVGPAGAGRRLLPGGVRTHRKRRQARRARPGCGSVPAGAEAVLRRLVGRGVGPIARCRCPSPGGRTAVRVGAWAGDRDGAVRQAATGVRCARRRQDRRRCHTAHRMVSTSICASPGEAPTSSGTLSFAPLGDRCHRLRHRHAPRAPSA